MSVICIGMNFLQCNSVESLLWRSIRLHSNFAAAVVDFFKKIELKFKNKLNFFILTQNLGF